MKKCMKNATESSLRTSRISLYSQEMVIVYGSAATVGI